MPRMVPLSPEAFSEAVGLSIPASGDASPENLIRTLGRHGALTRRWLPFANRLVNGALPVRDRELLILRTGLRCGSAYEWGQHVLLARQVGLTDIEIERVASGPDDPAWDADDRSLLLAADQLHDTSRLADELWAELSQRYDDEQLIEITMLVGHYHMVAYAANALEVDPDVGLPELPQTSP